MASETLPSGDKPEVYQISVLGMGGVGKTSFTNRFLFSGVEETYDPTLMETSEKRVIIDGVPCKIGVLDAADEENYAALRDQWLQGSDASLIVYSITSKESFDMVGSFWDQVKTVKNGQGMWAPYQICVLGNKLDLNDDGRVVSKEEGKKCAQKLGCAFEECSAKTGENVEKAMSDLVRKIRTYRDNERIRYEKMKEEAEKIRLKKDKKSKKSLWKRVLSR